ncbi:LysE family translocator [Oceanomicrobium pacificus]|uniref:LysE family transporter n=1 Tax=Oceanomicrobium pacificus TaxID=2692916 RepID=A0A6B0TXQ9_9RHOB|nr:LysE family translocator [Oceanomicrobium pacificus]MXU66238.1 LysE family transporter [Oceanomicrobium pacificus]
MSVDIVSFAVFAGAMVATPGPANMVLLSAGAGFGLRASMPFVIGVALSKQAIIWPVGLGLMTAATAAPGLFLALKYLSAAYIIYLAWRIASARIVPAAGVTTPPSFWSGLIVHPLNPKAWALVTAGFSNFVAPGTPALPATLAIAATLLGLQLVLHPLWCAAGALIAQRIAGTRAERGLMIVLALLTVASVAFVLWKGV